MSSKKKKNKKNKKKRKPQPSDNLVELHCGEQAVFVLERDWLDRDTRAKPCPVCDRATLHSTGEAVLHACPFAPGAPRSLLVRMSVGTFGEYSRRSLLHVGVSNSRGQVYNFDKRGRVVDEFWPTAVSIALPLSLGDEEFDAALRAFHTEEMSLAAYAPYHSLENNCYSYVVRFLNAVRFGGSDAHTKESVVGGLVERPICLIESYLSLHDRIQHTGFVVLDATALKNSSTPTRFSCDGCSRPLHQGDHLRCVECDDFDLCLACKELTTATHTAAHTLEPYTGPR